MPPCAVPIRDWLWSWVPTAGTARCASPAAPSAQVFSVELSAANAEVARRIWAHAGVEDQVTCVVGTIGDDHTLDRLRTECGFAFGAVDFLFIDHDKNAYLADLLSITDRGWLHPGSIVVADNVGFPGSPKYRAYMGEQQGRLWQTLEHKAHVEYQTLMPDLVLESEYLGKVHRPNPPTREGLTTNG